MNSTSLVLPQVGSRRGFVGKLGTAMFGALAAGLLKSHAALATHNPPPSGCYGYGICHCCSTGCGSVRADLGCPTGTGCWYWADSANCKVWRCCDYMYGGQPCLCRTLWCNCC